MVFILARRFVHAAAVMFAVASLVFAIVHLAGDPLAGLVPPGSSPEQEATLRRRFGLDRPLIEQYIRYLGGAVRGDFGESWAQRRPALEVVLERLPATLALTGTAVALALLVGVGLGTAAGVRPGGPADLTATGLALLGQALPGFWLGTMLILLFAVRLKWLPSSGNDGASSLILPAATLAAYPAALIARLLRASLIETLRLEYVRTARGKGLTPWQVVRRHALKNAALPTLGFVGVQIGFLLGGAVVVEAVFAYPGAGRLALQAVSDRDLPVIQAFVVVLAGLIVLVNLTVDLLARWLDPRIRFAASLRSTIPTLA
jgi:peptide/nickel transport system permease protein